MDVAEVTPPADHVDRPDDRFIPIRACDLVAALGQDPRFAEHRARLEALAEGLADAIQQETAAFERQLCDFYAHFNPDRDTIRQAADGGDCPPRDFEGLNRRLAYLFDKANFDRLSDAQIEDAMRLPNSYGLRVRLDPDEVQDLAIWVRGRDTTRRRRRGWRGYFRDRYLEISVYRRLAVMFRLQDSDDVVLKLFKEVPREDVPALLPHARVQMGLVDRLVVVGGGAGTLGSTAWKVVGSAGSLVAIGKLFWLLLVGLVTLVVRTALGYRRARRNSDSQRTRHLYYQNLGNNAGVLHSLLTMIAQEELKEALLAYVFCTRPEDDHPCSPEEMDRRIEQYLQQRFDVRVNFDARDAFETLDRLQLWRDRTVCRVVPPQQAVRTLQEHWRQRRTREYHCRQAGGGSDGSRS